MKAVIFCLVILTSLYSTIVLATDKQFIKNLSAAFMKPHTQTATPLLNQKEALMGYGGEDVKGLPYKRFSMNG